MYNGWKNYETWNVALWLQNDAELYELLSGCKTYNDFRNVVEISGTKDGVSWWNSDLDVEELDKYVTDLSYLFIDEK